MNKKGFTLIELLIVVVIIGILAAIAIPRFGETRERAYISAMQSDLNQLQTAMEMHYQEDFTYAGAVVDDLITTSQGVTVTLGTTDLDGWSATATHQATDQGCQFSNHPDDSEADHFNTIQCGDGIGGGGT